MGQGDDEGKNKIGSSQESVILTHVPRSDSVQELVIISPWLFWDTPRIPNVLVHSSHKAFRIPKQLCQNYSS